MNAATQANDPAINATVRASAGTGKTWLLVSRLIRLLFTGAQPDGILAITFTRKAAAEMHSRLAAWLLELATLDDAALDEALATLHVEPTADSRRRARTLYEGLLHAQRPLRTTTFHAFCQEILRRFPLEADVPPGFDLIEKDGELREAAWQALLDEAMADRQGEVAQDVDQLLIDCAGAHGMQHALESFLEHRGDWWALTLDAPDPAACAHERLRQALAVDENADPLAELFDASSQRALAEFRDLLALHRTQTNAAHLDLFADILAPTADPDRRHAALRAAFLTQKGEPRARRPSKTQAKAMGEAGELRFLALHGELCALLARVQDALNARQTLRLHAAWYRLGQRLLAHFQRIKEEQRLLDFNDLEWRAWRLLSGADNAHWVQYKLDQRIDHLLVDEFQDTNPTQWHLLLPLLREMAAGGGERPRSVFLVGDGKQSIYRFRRAEPMLFHAAQDWLEKNLRAKTRPLHKSWRSAPAIMDCVNRLFAEGGALSGLLDEFAPHETHHRELWGQVELLPLIEATTAIEATREAAMEATMEATMEQAAPAARDAPHAPLHNPLRNPLLDPRAQDEEETFLAEGRQIAQTLLERVRSGTLIGAADKARTLRYGDVLILVRKRSHVHAYEQALREAGIPYLGADRGTLLQSLEIDDMVCLLKTLIAPYDRLALAQVLRSPLFACSDEDLITLAKTPGGHWFGRLQQGRFPPGSALARAQAHLGRWHALADALPIHDLLDRIFSEGNLFARYESAFPVHLRARTRANLTRFIELALEIDHGRYPSLSRFLARLQTMRAQGESPDEAPPDGHADCVRLLTIHAAKGLEAPLVILADAAVSEPRDRAWQVKVDWPPDAERPHQFILLGKKENHDAYTREQLERERLAARREDANLLYVALTRARQLLYISASAPRRGTDLGWYGALQEALAQPIVSNAMPAQAAPIRTAAPIAASARTPAPPPALREVQPAAERSGEIAPSRSVPWAGAATGDEDGRQRGVVIHRLLELLNGGRDEAQARAAVFAELQGAIAAAELDDCLREASGVIGAKALQALFRPEHYQQAWNELPIVYRERGRTVHGIIDRLLLQNDELLIIDYKTHRQAADGDLNALAAPYRSQMDAYARGVQRLWPGKTVRRLLLFTAAQKIIES